MWLTPKQVQEELRISRPTIYRWIEDGTIPAIKLGAKLWRIEQQDLEDFKNGKVFKKS